MYTSLQNTSAAHRRGLYHFCVWHVRLDRNFKIPADCGRMCVLVPMVREFGRLLVESACAKGNRRNGVRPSRRERSRLLFLEFEERFVLLVENSSTHIGGMDGGRHDVEVTEVVATPVLSGDQQQDVTLKYACTKIIGSGSFGVVYEADLVDIGERVAIKKVLQDKRFKNRELSTMRVLAHQNVVRLKYFFYSANDTDLFLNLVMEFVPETVYRINRNYRKLKQHMPVVYVKLYMYQLLLALGYIHSHGICHRDVKPQNLLIDPNTSVLKLCDFGSAKMLVKGDPSVSYICSRYYRAPELLFGATEYSTSIDVWSTGCVLGELLSGSILFPGDSAVDQIVEIIKILGTPTTHQIHQMNPKYAEVKFPLVKPCLWTKLFDPSTQPEAIDLLTRLLTYDPNERMTPTQACWHGFFNQLQGNTNLPDGRVLPPFLNVNEREMVYQSH